MTDKLAKMLAGADLLADLICRTRKDDTAMGGLSTLSAAADDLRKIGAAEKLTNLVDNVVADLRALDLRLSALEKSAEGHGTLNGFNKLVGGN